MHCIDDRSFCRLKLIHKGPKPIADPLFWEYKVYLTKRKAMRDKWWSAPTIYIFWGKRKRRRRGINNMIIKVLLLLIYAKVPFWPSGQFPSFFPGATKKNRLYDYSIFPQFTKYNNSLEGKKVSVTKEKGKQINDVFALSRPSSKIFSSRISIYLNLWHESKLQKNSIHFFSPYYYAYWVVANQGKGKSGCLCQDEVSNFLSPTCCPLGRSH